VLLVVFTQVLASTSEVRALEGLVKALVSVLINIAPRDLLHAALAFIFTRHLQFCKLINYIRVSLACLESFEVAARAGVDALIFAFIDTSATEVDPAVLALTGLLEDVLADNTSKHLVDLIFLHIQDLALHESRSALHLDKGNVFSSSSWLGHKLEFR